MRDARSLCCSFLLAAGALLVTPAERADAVGYWNLPGNVCQWTGCGFGGGYHACFMLGPIEPAGWGDPHEIRLRCAPTPACGGCSCGGCGCGDMGGREFAAPSSMWDYTQPTAPYHAPAPAAF